MHRAPLEHAGQRMRSAAAGAGAPLRVRVRARARVRAAREPGGGKGLPAPPPGCCFPTGSAWACLVLGLGKRKAASSRSPKLNGEETAASETRDCGGNPHTPGSSVTVS